MDSGAILDYLNDHVSVKELKKHVRRVDRLLELKKQQAAERHLEDSKKRRKAEKRRIRAIMKHVVTDYMSLPAGMDAYHMEYCQFVRWLLGFETPVAEAVAQQHTIPQGWNMDKELGVSLKWSEEGFYVMRRRDSKFNSEYNPTIQITSQHESDNPNRKPKTQELTEQDDNNDVEPPHKKRTKLANIAHMATSSPIVPYKPVVIKQEKGLVSPQLSINGKDTDSDTESDSQISLDRAFFAERLQWQTGLDSRLQVGVAEYKKSGGWEKVAEYVGRGVTAQQCKNRWKLVPR